MNNYIQERSEDEYSGTLREFKKNAYKCNKVGSLDKEDFYLIYFSKPVKHKKYPWLILVDRKSENVIAKAMMDFKYGTFGSFAVDKDYRRQGYGEKFLTFATVNYPINNLMVLSSNKAAIHLYLKLGFKSKEVYYLDDGKYIYMELE